MEQNTNEKIPVIAVVGPTASGKTDLAAGIARSLDGEVVSFDSMQLYDFAPIATAMPTIEEMQGVPHHMLGFLRAGEEYSVAKYVADATAVIADIHSRGKRPVLVGGTGLYYQALIDNITFLPQETDPEVRRRLLARVQSEGLSPLYDELAQIDPETAARVHPNDQKRILRGLEVYQSTGRTLTRQRELSRRQPSPFAPCVLGITCRDRQKLYDRIDRRVELMLQNGLLAEAERVIRSDPGGTGMQAIGVKELRPYFSGEVTLREATDKIKQETRRYAKRQLTWFRRDERISWLYFDEIGRENLLKTALKIVENNVN